MERVAFLLEETGERLACMLNPESLTMRRLAGVRARRSLGGTLTVAGLSDDPLFYTGGGMTELELDLLFDITLLGSTLQTDDVRQLTAPLWQMAENVADAEEYARPPMIRFVWGKSWNIPGIIAAVAERLEHFTPAGEPRRSWLRMRFRRVADAGALVRAHQPPPSSFEIPTPEMSTLPGEATSMEGENRVHQTVAGERLDEIAQRYYGNPSLWRLLAAANGLTDPLHVPPGTVLRIPPVPAMTDHKR